MRLRAALVHGIAAVVQERPPRLDSEPILLLTKAESLLAAFHDGRDLVTYCSDINRTLLFYVTS